MIARFLIMKIMRLGEYCNTTDSYYKFQRMQIFAIINLAFLSSLKKLIKK